MTFYIGFSSFKYIFYLLNCYSQVQKILKCIFFKKCYLLPHPLKERHLEIPELQEVATGGVL